MTKDPQQAKLEKQIATFEMVVKQLSTRVQFLERENNRRKQEVNQIANSLRKN
jgi:outer membrane murein-binding lipoprotein Lpp